MDHKTTRNEFFKDMEATIILQLLISIFCHTYIVSNCDSCQKYLVSMLLTIEDKTHFDGNIPRRTSGAQQKSMYWDDKATSDSLNRAWHQNMPQWTAVKAMFM